MEAQRRKQAVAIVRSKCDTTVQACLKRDRTKTPEAAVQEFQTRYRQDMRKRLADLGVDANKVKIFLVNRCAWGAAVVQGVWAVAMRARSARSGR